MPEFKNINGQRFGRLTVIAQAPSTNNGVMWMCKCDCGTEKPVLGTSLRAGRTLSCGCYAKDVNAARCHKHGLAWKTDEYGTWTAMRHRCSNSNSTNYHLYGARGIRVCDRWDDFALFLQDMGPKPSKKHSIDRIDNDGNYCPENCRWATAKQQSHNSRRCVLSVGSASEIRRMRSAGAGFLLLAELFGVTRTHVRRVCNGTAWGEKS
jgi:hypothetical protein